MTSLFYKPQTLEEQMLEWDKFFQKEDEQEKEKQEKDRKEELIDLEQQMDTCCSEALRDGIIEEKDLQLRILSFEHFFGLKLEIPEVKQYSDLDKLKYLSDLYHNQIQKLLGVSDIELKEIRLCQELIFQLIVLGKRNQLKNYLECFSKMEKRRNGKFLALSLNDIFWLPLDPKWHSFCCPLVYVVTWIIDFGVEDCMHVDSCSEENVEKEQMDLDTNMYQNDEDTKKSFDIFDTICQYTLYQKDKDCGLKCLLGPKQKVNFQDIKTFIERFDEINTISFETRGEPLIKDFVDIGYGSDKPFIRPFWITGTIKDSILSNNYLFIQ